MPRYVAFFSAINVGANRIVMADLRWAFEREGLANVETVVASGNVLFDFDDRPSEGLEDLLGHMMAERFDIASFAAVRTRAEVAGAIAANPFAGQGEDDGADSRVHVHFLSAQPTQAQFEALVGAYEGRGPERMALGERALFVDYVDGVGRSRLTGPFLERRLGCRGTARNMRTLARILTAMDKT